MNTELVFIKRSSTEMEILGDNVYVEVDGEKIGLLATENLTINTTAGKHNIRIYKKKDVNSYYGEINADVEIEDGKALTIKYIEPNLEDCNGHIIVAEITSGESINKIIEQKDKQIRIYYEKIHKSKENKNIKKSKNRILAFMSAISFL